MLTCLPNPATKKEFIAYTKKRLASYDCFTDEVIDAAATEAGRLWSVDQYKTLFQRAGVPDAATLFEVEKGRGVPVIDIPPRTDGPSKGTIVYHLPMGNPLDANYRYHLATLAGAHPEYRFIAFGNPSDAPFRFHQQNLSVPDACRVIFGDARPLINAELVYLSEQKITDAYVMGFSYGAVKALVEATQLTSATLKGVIVMDPPSHRRAPWRLLQHFQETFTPMGEYVNRTKLSTYFAARAEADKTHHIGPGLHRPVNIVIGLMMAGFDLRSSLRKLMRRHPAIPINLVWGSRSELVDDTKMTSMVAELQQQSLSVIPRRLSGHHHAFANDVILEVALLHQALIDFQKS